MQSTLAASATGEDFIVIRIAADGLGKRGRGDDLGEGVDLGE